MENKYIQKIIANPNPDTLVPIWIPVPGSPGLYQEAYAPKGSFNLGYLRLSFNVSQSDTDAPVITPDQNEVGITLTTSYDAAGDYVLSFGRTVDATKVRIFGGLLQNVGLCFARCTSTTLNIQTNDTAGSPADDILANTAFELRFYPGWDA